MRLVSQNQHESIDFNDHSILSIKKGKKEPDTYLLFLSTRIGANGIVMATFPTIAEAIDARKYIEAEYERNARNLDLSEEGWKPKSERQNIFFK